MSFPSPGGGKTAADDIRKQSFTFFEQYQILPDADPAY